MALTVERVRKYMRDIPSENYKHGDKFFSDSEITNAIEEASSRAADMPPLGSGNTIPDYILLYGAIGILFEQKYINSVINYNPGIYENGLHVPSGEDAQLFQQLATYFLNRFEEQVRERKVAENITTAMTSRNAGSSWYRDTGRNKSGRGSGGRYECP